MISNSISPYIGKLIQPIISILMRCWDRSFETHLRKLTNFELAETERLQKEAKAEDDERKREARKPKNDLKDRKEEAEEDDEEEGEDKNKEGG
jgi:hypothetical protein